MIIMVGYLLTVYYGSFDEPNILYILSPSPAEMQFGQFFTESNVIILLFNDEIV